MDRKVKKIKKNINEKLKKENNNSFKTTEVLFLIILSSIVGIFIGYLINRSDMSSKKASSNPYVNEIIKQYDYIVDKYYSEIDENKLVSGAIDGMINSLEDDYAGLIDKSNNLFNVSINGQYKGIGVQVYNDKDDNIIVLDVLKDSPAYKAGIKPGDIIKEFDSVSFENKKITDFTNYINENPKETYNMVIERENQRISYNLKKENLLIKSVASEMIKSDNHKIGYIYISIFSKTTASQFEEALNNLEKENIESLIIDVRENGGGSLTSVVSILSKLMDSKHIIYQIKSKTETKKYYSMGNETKKYPIVVLQNSNSASASELLSAALKESYGAKIVGEKSYGKGTSQEMITLNNGDKYKFTTKTWLTPNGNSIDKKGIEPDYLITIDDNNIESSDSNYDNQLQKAIEIIIKESEK